MVMEQNPWLKALIILLVISAAIFLASQFWALVMWIADIIMLFFLAWLLSFVLKPLVSFPCRYLRLSRAVAVIIVYVGLILTLVSVMILIVPVIALQLTQLGTNLPDYAERLTKWIIPLQSELHRYNIDLDLAKIWPTQDLMNRVERLGTALVQNALTLITGLASLILGMIIVLVLSFYITLDGDAIAEQVLDLVPERYQDEVHFLSTSIDRTFGGFIRGQMIQSVIYGLGTALIMWLAGLGYVLVASIFAAIVMIIPFLGPILAIIPPLLIALFQLSLAKVLLVFVGLFVLQQIVFNIIAPKVMSESVGMHPLLVFLAILLGVRVAGLAGAIFGIPVVAVIYAMFHLFWERSPSIQARRARRSEAIADRAKSAPGKPPLKGEFWLDSLKERISRAVDKGSQRPIK
ncbi:MAG: AI-2E family transporter [Chloroflexi bacterium]|nr:AI-2E family transporter [Chloroflexota bacterium]MCL5075578.1 AI-2E family transporter [Chloroflexota bacterium]